MNEPATITEATTPARERVLHAAERLFTERGYRSVTLRDIAGVLGMKQASLYNHAPGGKEQLYIEVTERGLQRHGAHLRQVIDAGGDDLRAQLQAAARWLLSQPPLNLSRMSLSDMPSIDGHSAARLEALSAEALFVPIDAAVQAAIARGAARPTTPMMLAGVFLTMIESLHYAEKYSRMSREAMADEVIDIILDGIARR